MLLLLMSCTEAPPAPAAPAPTIAGLSAGAPQPAEVVAPEAPFTPQLSIAAADQTAILTDTGARYTWRPPEQPVSAEGIPLLDLTRAQERLVGLTEHGDLLAWPDLIPTGHRGEGLLEGDRDAGLVVVLQDGLRVVELSSAEVLWEAEASALSAITIGGGLVFDFDSDDLSITARSARTGEIRAQRTVRPPHRRARSRADQGIGLARPARAAPPGAPRTLEALRGALHYDPTTDRLFFRQLVLDGRTLQSIGHIQGIDRVLYADQSRIIAERQGWDGTVSVMQVDPGALTVTGRVPLLRPEGEAHIFYDPDTDSLTLTEPGRGRLLRWNAPLAIP